MKTCRTACLLACLALGLTAQAQGPNNTGTYYEWADGKTGEALKSALSECIYNRTERSYGNLWTDFRSTDARSDGKVWDMFSGVSNFTFGTDQDRGSGGKTEGEFYNREHSFPNSWFGSKTPPMYTDLHHVFPSDKLVNNKHSNNPLGEVGTPSWQSQGGFSKLGPARSGLGYGGIVFEPNDEYKGDFARAYFYMVTCYDEKIADWYANYADSREMLDGKRYPGLAKWALTMLMRWAAQDPVSPKEQARNEAVYKIQKNRNPFIDYPGLEQYVWGDRVGQPFHYDSYGTQAGVVGVTTATKASGKPLYNLKGQPMQQGRKLRRGVYVRGKKKTVVK